MVYIDVQYTLRMGVNIFRIAETDISRMWVIERS